MCISSTFSYKFIFGKPGGHSNYSPTSASRTVSSDIRTYLNSEILPSTFQINDSFHITGRGLVAAGDILSGRIKVGDIANIEIDGQRYNLRIAGVEMGDRLSVQEHFVGLVFKNDSDINLDGIKLNPQVIEIN